MTAELRLAENRWHAECKQCHQFRFASYTFQELAEWVQQHNTEHHDRF